MKSFKNIPVKFKPTPITIKEPYKPDLKSFENTDDFTAYFRANEELFKEPRTSEEIEPKFLSANKLNRTYKIPGYRIRIINKGKDNEELTLVKDYYTRATGIDEALSETINDTSNDKIVEMEQSIADIVEHINNIESFLLQLKR